MKDGPYFFYRTPDSKPILVEIWMGHISEAGEPDWRPLSAYSGVFVPLWAQQWPPPFSVPATVGQQATQEAIVNDK